MREPHMDVEIVGKFLSTLPEDDDHPYRTGPWRPQTTEWRADDLVAVEGEIPADLDGIYLRNTENPLHPALKFYHPFDGDGMLHIVGFRDGKAFYRNRFVRTEAFEAEQEAGGPLWPGLAEPLSLAKADHGWGARTMLKDASSTDVVVHRGTALTSFYQCGDLYRIDPYTGETLGKETWNGSFPLRLGRVGASRRSTTAPGRCCSSTTASRRRICTTGWWTPNNDLVHYVDVPLPGPRLPHDMAFTRNYAIFNDFPLFWDPELLQRDLHVPRFHRDMPSRFAVHAPPRRAAADIQWFEADPTFVLHFTNAYEDGDEIVLDGFYQGDPQPADDGTGSKWQRAFRFLALDRMQTRLHRWRFNLKTGTATEEPLSDTISEFGMINAAHGGEPYRYAYAATGKPGWFLFDGLVRHDVRERHRGPDQLRRRRLRQRDRDGAAGRQPRRGRRLSGDADHRHERRRLLLPGVRRRPSHRRPGVQNTTARTDFQRHPLHLGGGIGGPAVAGDRLRGGRRRALMPNRITRLEPGGVNAIGRMLGLLGDEWNLLILQQALMGASRYRHFIARLPISNAVLAGRLRVLTDAGLLDRPAHPTSGERAEYLPTARSRSLWPVLLCIWQWERCWVAEHAGQLPAMRHQGCGRTFSPVLRCSGCHGAISATDVGRPDRAATGPAQRRRRRPAGAPTASRPRDRPDCLPRP